MKTSVSIFGQIAESGDLRCVSARLEIPQNVWLWVYWLTKVLQQGFDFSVNPVSGHVLNVSG